MHQDHPGNLLLQCFFGRYTAEKGGLGPDHRIQETQVYTSPQRVGPPMFNLMPRDPSFYDDLDRLAAMAAKCIDLLAKSFDSSSGLDQAVSLIEKERHNAHVLTREILRRLDEAFITPFDREDILQLDSDLYGVVARVASTAERMQLYEMREAYPQLRGQCTILNSIGGVVHEVVTSLRRNNLSTLRARLDEIGRLEERSREERRQFLADLYRGAPDPIDAIKKKELHDLMMEAIRSCDSVGRTVERVLLKNA
jgi:uncharacterized protein Yka (UPF0111/DUF47 family)